MSVELLSREGVSIETIDRFVEMSKRYIEGGANVEVIFDEIRKKSRAKN
jgi:hypothetical protein